MDNNSPELKMARRFYGYGFWGAPYWFIGPEQGKGPQETADNTPRVSAWLMSGAVELCDCYDYHCLISEKRWHQENPRLQPTWRRLMLLLMTFLNKPADNDSLRGYQRDRWGRVSGGETCVIELSALAVRSSREKMDREQFRAERIETIHAKMLEYKPKLVVMYGMKDRAHWEKIAGCGLICDDVVTVGATMLAFTPHPNKHGRANADWVALGKKLQAKSGISCSKAAPPLPAKGDK